MVARTTLGQPDPPESAFGTGAQPCMVRWRLLLPACQSKRSGADVEVDETHVGGKAVATAYQTTWLRNGKTTGAAGPSQVTSTVFLCSK